MGLITLDYIITGQGLAGSLLARELLRAGKKLLIIDENKKFTSSKIAAGLVLPVSGRRIVKTWKADLLIRFAKNFYLQLEKDIGERLFYDLPVIEIFSSVKNSNDWLSRSGEPTYKKYIGEEIKPEKLNNILNTGYGGITVNNSGFLDISKSIELLRKYFQSKNIFEPAVFSFDDLKISKDGVKWKNYFASKIIFCEGYNSVMNPFFKHLPYLPAKGEILKIYSDKLPENYIINHGMHILPMGNHEFKVGSTFQWNFKDDCPSKQGKEQIENFLRKFLKVNYKIISYEAAIRPTVQDRRPFVGLHAIHPCIGIFNGLGTKGVILAPYFAKQFADFLDGKSKIDEEADVKRYIDLLG